MTAAEFDVILEQRVVEMRRVLGLKAGEYASRKDRLHNFKESARLLPIDDRFDETAAEALAGMLRKHWMSLMDIVARHAYGDTITTATIDEKIGDAVCYLVLLEAVLKERS